MKMERGMLGVMLCISIGSLFLTIPTLAAATTGDSIAKPANYGGAVLEEMTEDVFFDGAVVLEEGNFTWYDKDGNPHEVANFTPHGALEVAAHDGAFDYNGSWKGSKNTALID